VQIARRCAIAAVVLLVGAYYLWSVRAAGLSFLWGYDLGGYYNYLARGLASGHTWVALQPSPKLLAQPDPWDPAVDDSLKMHDMALFHRHYYLYHGVGPAVLLFVPWRLATGHDMPENFALFLLCFGGFLFAAAALLRLLALAGVRPHPGMLALMLLALGVCQAVPYLLNRVWVYEVAIGGGYFSISAAAFFLSRAVESRRDLVWIAASGLMFGLAIACRPHLGLAGLAAMAGVGFVSKKTRRIPKLIAFVIPFVLVGFALAVYNYQRFGNFFEFGNRYLLGGAGLNRTTLEARYVLPGLYYMLFCRPDFSVVFPWVRAVFRFLPLSPFPPGYFVEPIAGALFLAPFVVAALFIPAVRGVRMLLVLLLISSAAILLFVTGTGFTSQRYEVDFLPLAVLVAVTNFAIHIARAAGWKRHVLSAALVLLVGCGVVANAALGITGPLDEMLKNRPFRYARMARWFSPVDQLRPLLNPNVSVEFQAEVSQRPDGSREPLLAMGWQTGRDILYFEHHLDRLRLVSEADGSTVAQEVPYPGLQPVAVRVAYTPDSHRLTVSFDGREVLTQEVPMLLTAPAQVTVGENRIDRAVTPERFSGRINAIQKSLRAR
jgi:hypothetical protein